MADFSPQAPLVVLVTNIRYARPGLLCNSIVVQSDNATHLNPAGGGARRIDLYNIAASNLASWPAQQCASLDSL